MQAEGRADQDAIIAEVVARHAAEGDRETVEAMVRAILRMTGWWEL